MVSVIIKDDSFAELFEDVRRSGCDYVGRADMQNYSSGSGAICKDFINQCDAAVDAELVSNTLFV